MRYAETCGCPLEDIGPSMANSCGGGSFLVFMSILETFLNGRCDLADPCNRVPRRDGVDHEYDFVVVGGGTAGPVVASRLSENPAWKVLLLEAGGDEPPVSSVPSLLFTYWGNPHTDWNYNTEPEEIACQDNPEHRCSWIRGKMLGGCSAVNGMMYMRGHQQDYDNWAAMGAEGWGWNRVRPYFLRSEDNMQIGKLVESEHHGTGGYLTTQQFNHRPQLAEDLLKAGEELGHPSSKDLNGGQITGFAIAQTLNRNGSRLSAARAFLRPAAHRTNLHVLLHAHGARVLVDPDTKAVAGVEFIHNGAKKTVRINKEVILSAGTLNSPQILLLSGIGPQQTLKQHGIPVVVDLPGVGQNLHNHVGVHLPFYLEKEPQINEMNWASAMEYMLNRQGPLSSTGLSQVTGIINSKYANPSGKHPDIQFFFSGSNAGCASSGEVGSTEDPHSPDKKRDVVISAIYLHPKSRGYITLKSANPNDAPLMFPRYFSDPEDIDRVVDGARTALKFADTQIMKNKYGMQLDLKASESCLKSNVPGTDGYLLCMIKYSTAPENHQAGTCKIGSPNDPMAVVDSQLNVYGVKGLRVMDASVMPAAPSGNTVAPTMMIAERGADFIKNKWSSNKPPAVFQRLPEVTDTPAADAAPSYHRGYHHHHDHDSPYAGHHGNFENNPDWHRSGNKPLPSNYNNYQNTYVNVPSEKNDLNQF